MRRNSMAIIAIALAITVLLTGTAAAEILAESPHPYPDEYDNAWVITEPGATQMRLHFQRYHLETVGDMIRLYDGSNRLMKTYSGDGINYENVWTDWYPTNFIRVRFTSDSVGDAWGFLVDQKESNAAPPAPASVINLHNTSYQQTSITWNWTDPASADFDHVIVYLDGMSQTNVTKGIQTFSAQGLSPSTSYTIATQTVGTTGLINQSWVNHTATTAPEPPVQVAPESVANLHNITYQQTSITWNWTDPASADFDHVIVYLDGVFQANVTKGIQTFSAQGLSPSTSHTIATRTAGTTGLVNQSWVNHTAATSPSPDALVLEVTLNEGWNIFSTPVLLEENQSQFSQVFPEVEQEKILVALGWDGAQWYCPAGSDTLRPLYAYFIKVADGEIANATLVPSNVPSAPPERTVSKGMNLIGVAPAYDPGTQSFPEMPLDEALVTIEEVGELPGYAIVISPSLNQPGWSYAKGGQVYNVQPFKGYWVFMNNGPDTLAGFSTTPIT